MKITTLIENLVYKKGLVAEHGLSFYFNYDNQKIIIDTGQSGNFIKNASALGINIIDVDYVIITHGHYDHTGGLIDFLKINNKAKIIIKPDTLQPKLKNNNYIGIPKNLKIPEDRIYTIQSNKWLTQNIYILTNIHTHFTNDFHNENFYVNNNKEIKEDLFTDELSIVIKKDNQINIISSCSHNGITNIIETAKKNINLPVNLVLGGFHINRSSREVKDFIVKYLNNNNTKQIGFCHCSGIDNFSIFQNKCNAKVFYNYTGNVIEL